MIELSKRIIAVGVAVAFMMLLLIVVCRGEERNFFSRPGEPTVRDDESLNSLRARVKDLESQLLAAKSSRPAPDIDITGIGELKATGPQIQWVVTSAPGCGHCPAYKQALRSRLRRWTVSDSPDSQFRLVEITNEEWNRRGITLPLSELIINGQVAETRVGVANPDELANLYNQYNRGLVPDPNESYGIGVGSVPVKAQVAALLTALRPFLDGGSLRVEYKPKPGVVREWLTIKQGSGGVKIPSTTAIVFEFDGNTLVGKFEGTSPRVIVGPFERGPKQIEISTERIAIRLPWCPDPEIKLTE